jgi:hypothetical protein
MEPKSKMKISTSIIFFAISFTLLNSQSTNHDNHIKVLIFNDQQKISVYDSFKGNNIINYLKNDTIKEDYFVIEVLKSKNNRYQIEGTSILNKGIIGWIDLQNIGINTRSRDHKLLLYNEPNYSANHIVTNENDRLVRVTSISSNWLKIIWIDKNEYWLPAEYQCPNPYTTCN